MKKIKARAPFGYDYFVPLRQYEYFSSRQIFVHWKVQNLSRPRSSKTLSMRPPISSKSSVCSFPPTQSSAFLKPHFRPDVDYNARVHLTDEQTSAPKEAKKQQLASTGK